MKIYWPWRRKKPLSLFETRVLWLGEDPNAKPPCLSSMGPSYLQRHPLNAEGPFYVSHGECISCGSPHVVAPELMAWEMNAKGHVTHCYFRKQPETPQEIEQAILAMRASCCGALRYGGSDPEIIQKLEDAGL